MESTIEDIKFRSKLRKRLDKLSLLYLKDEKEFIKEFISTPKEFIKEIIRCRLRVEEYRNTKLFDIAEYSSEVLYYYDSYRKKCTKLKEKKKSSKENKKKYKSFTLHNPRDLERFEGFLDRMLRLLELNPDKFVDTLPKCPVELWDKIDDLRETSFKEDRDSPEYTRCLQKSKKISLTYFKLSRPPSIWKEIEEDSYE